MARMVDRLYGHELSALAKGAKIAFEKAKKTGLSVSNFIDFFPPPVCEHADERMDNVLHLGRKKGDLRMYRGQIIARVEKRQVRGLRLWSNVATNRFEDNVIVKNPKSAVSKSLFKCVGVQNALVLQRESTGRTKAYLAAITGGIAYVIRPVIPDFQKDIVKQAKRMLK